MVTYSGSIYSSEPIAELCGCVPSYVFLPEGSELVGILEEAEFSLVQRFDDLSGQQFEVLCLAANGYRGRREDLLDRVREVLNDEMAAPGVEPGTSSS